MSTHGGAGTTTPFDDNFPIPLPICSMTSPFAKQADDALIAEVTQLLVDALNLETPASDIAPDTPLYGDGLGLDSIDILEVALAVSKRYGFQLRADNEDNTAIYASLRSLADYIATHRTS